jgi:SAM-dependent methyltransferase
MFRQAGRRHPALLIPASRNFGLERGQPVDRFYVDDFLARHTDEAFAVGDVRGHVLEIGGDPYARRFGSHPGPGGEGGLDRVDVLDINPLNRKATIVGDLADPETLPAETFDCIICAQTLMYIYDVNGAIASMHGALRPGGVALITVPGISRILRPEIDRYGDYWRFTSLSLRRLLEEVFPADAVTVQAYGNVRAATAFLYGLAAEELSGAELELHDRDYEVIVGARAEKPG